MLEEGLRKYADAFGGGDSFEIPEPKKEWKGNIEEFQRRIEP